MEATQPTERATLGLSAPLAITLILSAMVAGVGLVVAGVLIGGPALALTVIGALLVLVALPCWAGLIINGPNQARVLTLFGRYRGTVKKAGWWWVLPFTGRRRVSLRVRNFDSDTLKVNDAAGNPVEIAAVITWQVVDTAKAVFQVEDYDSFVRLQAEAAIRHVASEYPYDDWAVDDRPSLRGNAEQVMATLTAELQGRLDQAGVTVLDSRLRRLAYAPEIAQEMLRRQQASAVVAARKLIVEGAVGMVEQALDMLNERQVVQLDEERKAQMVSNLLVVLCSDRGAQPVVNSGTLYQ